MRSSSDALAASVARGFARRFRLLRFSDRFAALTFELGNDVVVDPLLVPPLHRQNGDPVQIDSIVQMIANGQACLAGLAEDLPFEGDEICLYQGVKTSFADE